MTKELIAQILSGKYIDPDTGKPLDVPVKEVLIEQNIAANAVDYVRNLDLGNSFAIVCDENTKEVLAEDFHARLLSVYNNVKIVVLEKVVKADITAVESIRRESSSVDALIAVGSGTINDLCKYASFLDKKPYIVFATAPSMNGYVSANAAITIDGHKKSLAAHLPAAVYMDLDILSNAPRRLIASGVGDSLCRGTCQADWLLSHYFVGTKYSETPFLLLHECENYILREYEAVAKCDLQAIEALSTMLILSGIGMYISGGSYPASQAEHMIAHTLEMVHGNKAGRYHGEDIIVSTLTMVNLQLQRLSSLSSECGNESSVEELRVYFGESVAGSCASEYGAKMQNKNDAERINCLPNRKLSDIRERIEKVVLSHSSILKVAKSLKLPLSARDLGWSGMDYNQAVRYAKYSRNRFTFLDLI